MFLARDQIWIFAKRLEPTAVISHIILQNDQHQYVGGKATASLSKIVTIIAEESSSLIQKIWVASCHQQRDSHSVFSHAH